MNNPLHTIGVIGAGIVGSGIAQVGAPGDLSVVLLDVDEARSARPGAHAPGRHAAHSHRAGARHRQCAAHLSSGGLM
jgi:3-hydroxyacyl-CoA dehydrogenase